MRRAGRPSVPSLALFLNGYATATQWMQKALDGGFGPRGQPWARLCPSSVGRSLVVVVLTYRTLLFNARRIHAGQPTAQSLPGALSNPAWFLATRPRFYHYPNGREGSKLARHHLTERRKPHRAEHGVAKGYCAWLGRATAGERRSGSRLVRYCQRAAGATRRRPTPEPMRFSASAPSTRLNCGNGRGPVAYLSKEKPPRPPFG
jgi:hypothetical protein